VAKSVITPQMKQDIKNSHSQNQRKLESSSSSSSSSAASSNLNVVLTVSTSKNREDLLKLGKEIAKRGFTVMVSPVPQEENLYLKNKLQSHFNPTYFCSARISLSLSSEIINLLRCLSFSSHWKNLILKIVLKNISGLKRLAAATPSSFSSANQKATPHHHLPKTSNVKIQGTPSASSSSASVEHRLDKEETTKLCTQAISALTVLGIVRFSRYLSLYLLSPTSLSSFSFVRSPFRWIQRDSSPGRSCASAADRRRRQSLCRYAGRL
jgi:hypothetical protein